MEGPVISNFIIALFYYSTFIYINLYKFIIEILKIFNFAMEWNYIEAVSEE